RTLTLEIGTSIETRDFVLHTPAAKSDATKYPEIFQTTLLQQNSKGSLPTLITTKPYPESLHDKKKPGMIHLIPHLHHVLQSEDVLQVIRRSTLTTIYSDTTFNASCFPKQSSAREN
ncbi:hypothetical protein GIB67_022829, partial [Kingdonia uniflora]